MSRKSDTHTVIRAVLETLRSPVRDRTVARRAGLSPGELAGAVNAFVNAGTRAVRAKTEPSRWVAWHFKIDLAGRSVGRQTRLNFLTSLERAGRRWLDKTQATDFNFLLKNKGARVRVAAAKDPEGLDHTLARWASRWPMLHPRRELYEPEEYQFGGPSGMAIAHRYATADSFAAIEMLKRSLAGSLDSPEDLSILCITDLVEKLVLDRWEMWDAWRNLRLTGRLDLDQKVPAKANTALGKLGAYYGEMILNREKALSGLGKRERRIVRAYEKPNSEAARGLRKAANAGQLLFPPRKIIPFWIIFHWNRWGFGRAAQNMMALSVERALNPKLD
jgi:thiopeptide-type bacteriocin biosynthesis protein